jgi:hypothetical protein
MNLTIGEADKFLEDFGEDEAKNLNLLNRFQHTIKNIWLPAVGLESFKDPRMAEYRARADALSASAMSAIHKAHGGGMMSLADVKLYEKAIPNTTTYSPVEYRKKFNAWRSRLAGAINYMDAKSRMAELPKEVVKLTPFEVQGLMEKVDPKTKKPVLDWATMHFLAEESPQFRYKNGDPNNPWTFKDVQKLVKDGNITYDFGIRWLDNIKGIAIPK